MLKNKTILVTGGTGSFGKKFIKTVIEKHNPAKIVVYSRDELKQFEMQNDVFLKKFIGRQNGKLRFFIGDVRDLPRLKMAMGSVDIVVHAAALKHVPIAEYNPFEAVKTNILGAQNVIDAALGSNVSHVIALSTDKAAAPINLYGATKLASDKLFVAANNYKGKQNIKFSVVRYGNVMGSRGSVIPYFIEQQKFGLLPITDDRMTRFNITLSEGVQFVLNCLDIMWGGELFIPKIPSYKIIDVAKAIGPECEFKNIGIRPGEKLHEEMLTISDSINTVEFDKYYVIMPSITIWNQEDFVKKSSNNIGRFCKSGFAYNSKTNKHFLSVNDIKVLIEKNLMLK